MVWWSIKKQFICHRYMNSDGDNLFNCAVRKPLATRHTIIDNEYGNLITAYMPCGNNWQKFLPPDRHCTERPSANLVKLFCCKTSIYADNYCLHESLFLHKLNGITFACVTSEKHSFASSSSSSGHRRMTGNDCRAHKKEIFRLWHSTSDYRSRIIVKQRSNLSSPFEISSQREAHGSGNKIHASAYQNT